MNESIRCRGMRDILPQEMQRFRRIEKAFRDVCRGWGYGEIRTPTIEHLHLFTAAGTLSPQLLGRVYSFLDWDGWSGERVVLRPDSTIPAARLYVEQLAGQRTAKLYYVQNVLRFAEADESREDWQCGVELIGPSHPQGDVEIVLVACEVLQSLGLNAEIKLSDPKILRAILSGAGFDKTEQLVLYDRVLDGDDTALDDAQARLPDSTPPLKGLLSMEGTGAHYLNNLRSALAPSIPEIAPALDEITAISEVLTLTGVGHRIAPILVRNFEYYTGPVFHLYANGQKLGGGGRYDALMSLVGGASAPASGFALEIDAISSQLPDDEPAINGSVSIRLAGKTSADLGAAFSLASTLRNADVRVDFAGAEPVMVEIVASSTGFELTANGAAPRRLKAIDDVVRAVAETALE